MQAIKGMVYTDQFVFEPGVLTIDGDTIQSVERCGRQQLSGEELGRYLIPGLTDIHFHGCAGHDFCDGTKEAMAAIGTYELSHGITTISPATMTFDEERLAHICSECAEAAKTQMLEGGIPFGSVLKGIYLEGPFISHGKKGAQNPAYIHKPDMGMLDRLQQAAQGLIKIVAIAPETDGAIACIREGGEKYRFSIAHTCADYDTAKEAVLAGAKHVTHLYNAMPPFTHRAPGVVGAVAEDGETRAELICDGIHIHPSVVCSTFRLFGAHRMVLISDSMMAAGMADGSYMLGGQGVQVKGSLAVLGDGTIAGSVTNLYDCMKKAISMGVPKEDAVRAATLNPAKAIGIEKEYGSLAAGKKADILIADLEWNLLSVIKSGR